MREMEGKGTEAEYMCTLVCVQLFHFNQTGIRRWVNDPRG